MPRRGRMSSPSPTRAPARAAPAPTRSHVPAPAPAPPSSVMQAPAGGAQQPGLLKQMAATAGGVAIGSTVGHVVGHALVGGIGGGGGGSGEVAQSQQPAAAPQQQQVNQQDPCAQEIQAFLRCAQGQSDLTLCEGFNEAIRQCRQFGQSQSSAQF